MRASPLRRPHYVTARLDCLLLVIHQKALHGRHISKLHWLCDIVVGGVNADRINGGSFAVDVSRHLAAVSEASYEAGGLSCTARLLPLQLIAPSHPLMYLLMSSLAYQSS